MAGIKTAILVFFIYFFCFLLIGQVEYLHSAHWSVFLCISVPIGYLQFLSPFNLKNLERRFYFIKQIQVKVSLYIETPESGRV